jgi:glycosyltransferase involved in cell wall biosynthesis
VFAGREAREKGLGVLLEAWRASSLDLAPAALVLVGVRSALIPAGAGGAVRAVGPQPPDQVRNFYAGASVVVIPSIPTPTFREPWGLVANEAMNQRVPIIASDAVGAVAGGLVRHERNGLVIPAGDADSLAEALRRLHADPALRVGLGEAGVRDVAAFTFEAWAGGFSAALTETHRIESRC